MHEPEIDRVHTRCKRCGQATHFVVNYADHGEDERYRLVARVEGTDHTRDECERFERLEREQWPTLW